jgi:hypothetical protein
VLLLLMAVVVPVASHPHGGMNMNMKREEGWECPEVLCAI